MGMERAVLRWLLIRKKWMTLWMAADMDLFEEVAQVHLSEDESISICKDDDDDDDDDPVPHLCVSPSCFFGYLNLCLSLCALR